MAPWTKSAISAGMLFTLSGATQVDYVPSRSPIYVVESIECIEATSGSSSDSVYLSQQPGGLRIPRQSFSMSAGDKQVVGEYFYPEKPGKLKLYEADFLTGDDKIGEFAYDLRETSGTYTVTMTGDGGEYIVIISVRR
jgi:hypothetical protein